MTTSTCATRRGRWCSRVLRLLGPAVVVGAMVVHLGTGAVLDGVRAVSPGALVVALVLGAITTTASAARWCLVARGLGLEIRFGGAVRDCYRAQFLNSVLPAGVLGDVYRAVDSGRRSGDVGRGVRAVVLERTAGQVVVTVVGVAVLVAVPGPVRNLLGDLDGPGPAALAAAGVVLGLSGLAAVPRVRLALVTLAVGTRDAVLTLRNGPTVAGLSLVAMAGHLALLAVAASAVGVQATPGQLLPLLVLSLLSMGLPLTVGGWGPREATTAAAFGAAGLGASTGLATAVAFGVLALVSTLPGLGVLLLRRPGTTSAASPEHAIAQVRDAPGEVLGVRRRQPAHQLELDVIGGEVVEEASPATEQDRHDVQLHLVELPRAHQRLRGAGPVHHDVAVPGRRAGHGRGLVRVRGVDDAARWRVVGDLAGQDDDRDAVVVVPAPAPGQLEGAATGEHRARRHRLGVDLPARARVQAAVEPVEQSVPAAAQRVVGTVVRPRDEAVEGDGHVQADGHHRSPARSTR
jgi:uncharacterized membrane protein YbhN (UPF0104 family)